MVVSNVLLSFQRKDMMKNEKWKVKSEK